MTIILRHKRENLKKCSLRGLETREDMQFFTYPIEPLPPLGRAVLLTFDAPLLTREDKDFPLLLIDGTWKYASVMEKHLSKKTVWVPRSLPTHFRTAYPRKQTGCQDPSRGLASVEALFIAYHLLGRDTKGFLDHYYWKEDFLKKNRTWISSAA